MFNYLIGAYATCGFSSSTSAIRRVGYVRRARDSSRSVRRLTDLPVSARVIVFLFTPASRASSPAVMPRMAIS